MEQLKHLNSKRQAQVNQFLKDLPIDNLSITNIRLKYFGNSRSFCDEIIKHLEESKVIVVERPGKIYLDGKWIAQPNKYSLSESLPNKPVVEEVSVQLIKFNGEHIVIERPTHINRFKKSLRLTKQTFGHIYEKAVIEECLLNGLNRYQAEYLWLRYTESLEKRYSAAAVDKVVKNSLPQ